MHAENQENENIPKPLLDYRIKLLFLGIKNAWQVYKTRGEELKIRVEGKEIERYFESGKLVKLINISIENSLTQENTLG